MSTLVSPAGYAAVVAGVTFAAFRYLEQIATPSVAGHESIYHRAAAGAVGCSVDATSTVAPRQLLRARYFTGRCFSRSCLAFPDSRALLSIPYVGGVGAIFAEANALDSVLLLLFALPFFSLGHVYGLGELH